ncbi:hypothetical protein ACFZAV_21465 [Streptomyces sp. NPDC008343]|uniref:hypothetical protein n=1 Tax=Streptomyces sp. NPDC008343 TaxID=3364828 RepID=UPI0036F17755
MVKPLSSIEIAVLGLISGKTMGGSELQAIYQVTNNVVWPSRRSGLWEVAARLADLKYLVDRGDRHPQRWSITDHGIEALSNAVSTANPKPAVRFPIFVICAYLEYARDWDTVEEVLRAHKAAWENVLVTEREVLDNIVTARSPLVRARLDRSPHSGRASQLVKKLALQGQVGIASNMIDWAAESLHRIAELRVHGELPSRPAAPDGTLEAQMAKPAARLSPIQIAVLGLIGAQPMGMSGSDLKRHYRATSARLWPSEDHGLYPVAARLSEHGYLHDRGDRHPARFCITGAGIKALSEAVSHARPEPAVRFPIFVACAYFEYARDWASVERVLLNHRAAWLDVLAGEEQVLDDIATGRSPLLLPPQNHDPEALTARVDTLAKTLAIRGEIAIAKFMIGWVEQSLGAIAGLRDDMGELTRPPLPDQGDTPEEPVFQPS